jgi:hypothetical protein
MLQNFIIPWNISFTFGNQNLIPADARCTWYKIVIKYVSDLQRVFLLVRKSSFSQKKSKCGLKDFKIKLISMKSERQASINDTQGKKNIRKIF